MNLKLLKSNFSALSLKFCLDVVSLFLGSASLNNLRSTVNNVLSLFQTKTCYFTNNLDNFNLVRANLCQLNVELSLLFLSCCCRACCYNNACCCGYTELFLTSFY